MGEVKSIPFSQLSDETKLPIDAHWPKKPKKDSKEAFSSFFMHWLIPEPLIVKNLPANVALGVGNIFVLLYFPQTAVNGKHAETSSINH